MSNVVAFKQVFVLDNNFHQTVGGKAALQTVTCSERKEMEMVHGQWLPPHNATMCHYRFPGFLEN